MTRPRTAAEAGRYLRWWMAVTAVLAVVVWTAVLVAYVKDRELISGPTRPVIGQVVKEENGFLGIRNLLTVEYQVDGQSQRKTIPVKGRGIGGLRLSPYFYQAGAAVDLLVSRDDPGAVRTDDRWTPATYVWAAVGGTLLFTLALLVAVAAVTVRQHRRREADGG